MIYLIIGDCEDGYGENFAWHVCAFSDKGQAETHLKKLVSWLKKNRINQLGYDAEIPKNSPDPEFENKFIGGAYKIGYKLVEVPFEG